MRLSMLKRSPTYEATQIIVACCDVHVYLDGVYQRNVIEADDLRGTVTRYTTASDGSLNLDQWGRRVRYEKLRGRVVIERRARK